MNHLDKSKAAGVVLFLAVLLAAGAPGLRAQSSFVLSKHADFSTDDRGFDRSDTIYMLITAPAMDFTDLKKNEFRLKPDEGGNDIRGVFTNHLDGTYTASVPLAITDPNEDEWEWRARIKDEDGNEFEARVTLQIGEDDGGGDDDDDEGDDEVELTGIIEALDAGSITVDGIPFVVDNQTVVLDDNNNPILFADLMVGMTVEIRGDRGADGVLVATRIKIEDEDDGDDEVELTGTIEALDAGSITVDGISFVVDDQTVVLDDDNNPISFDDLVIGMRVEIRGDRGADGVLVATRIKIEDNADVTGRLAAVEADRLTVEERTFLVNGSTQILDENDTPMALSGLEVGQMVAVYARDATASLPLAARIKVMGAVALAAESDVPGRFLLEQNYPNPFNPKTTIAFEIGPEAASEPVSLVIYNLLGEAVQTLVQGNLGPGRHQYVWEARNSRGDPVATGLYLYRLRVGEQVQTRTMVLLK